MEGWCRKKRGLLRREEGLRGLRPFAPAVSMQSVRLEPAPKGGPADAQLTGGFRQLPAVSVQRLDDSLLLPRRQRRGSLDPGNKHRFAQFHGPDPKRTQPPAQGSQSRLKIRGAFGQIPILERFPGRLIGVENSTAMIKNNDPFAESVEDSLGERREDSRQLVE